MKLSSSLHRLACSLVPATLLLIAWPAVAQQRTAGAQATTSFPGMAAEGLTITLALDHSAVHPSKLPMFRVELRNASRHDLLLNLGTISSDGIRQFPSGISFVLAGTQGQPQHLVLKTFPESSYPENKRLLLPLPAGATFSFPADLRNYWVVGSNGSNSKLAPGKYMIEAQFTDLPGIVNVRPFPEQSPRELPVSEAPFDQVVHPQPNAIPTSNELHFEIAR